MMLEIMIAYPTTVFAEPSSTTHAMNMPSKVHVWLITSENQDFIYIFLLIAAAPAAADTADWVAI